MYKEKNVNEGNHIHTVSVQRKDRGMKGLGRGGVAPHLRNNAYAKLAA